MILCSEIRARARAALGSSIFSGAWLFALLFTLVVSVINSILSFTGIGTLIIYGLLSIGLANYFVGRVRGTVVHDDFNSVFDAAKNDIGGNIILGILYNIFIALWTCLFIIPGIVKSCSYAMTFYIKNDHPEMTATEAITESRRMMDGYKMKYFVLQLSFIGWYIVGALCLGIGALWVTPYVSAASAVFYEELKAIKCPSETSAPLYETVLNG